MSRVKEWGSIQSVGKQSAPLSSCLFFGHWTLEQTKAEEFLRSQKRKALRFFPLIIPVFCGNNQALYILYLLHSWLFGLTNISSHTLPSQPFLENTPPPFFIFLKTFPLFSMAAVWSQWASRALRWCTYCEGSFCVIGWEGPWAVGIHTWIRIWTL